MAFGHEKFMELVVGGNLSGKSGWVDWAAYARAVPRFLGWPTALLMGLGLWEWAARGASRERFLLTALLIPLAALNAIPTRELRYLIILFPAAFAALGQGLARAGELISPRWPLAGALAPWLFLAALPWESAREAAVWLAREPSLPPCWERSDASWKSSRRGLRGVQGRRGHAPVLAAGSRPRRSAGLAQ